MSGRICPDNPAAILFDKDGTLIDYDKTWLALNREAARIAGSGNPELEKIILTACGTDPETGKTVADSMFAVANTREIAEHMISLGSKFDRMELTERLDLLYSRGAHNSVALCDLKSLLGDLKARGYVIGIASSDNEEAIRTTTIVHEIDGHVDFLAGYDSGHGTKPGPGMVHALCADINCPTSQVIVVGDNRHDMEMGRNAGVGFTVGVLSGTGTAETLGNCADVVLKNVMELPRFLES